MQRTILQKFNKNILQTEIKGVHYEPVRKQTGFIDVSGFGKIATMTSTGKYNKSRIMVDSGHLITVDATKAEVDKRWRKLRNQEAQQLDEIDAQIQELRSRRAALLQDAWRKGNVVTVTELIALAEK